MRNRGPVDDNHIKEFCYKYILITSRVHSYSSPLASGTTHKCLLHGSYVTAVLET